MSTPPRARTTIGILAVTQIVTWGCLYYAFSIVAADVGREMDWRPELVFGAFSWCLLVAGLVATPAGVLLDRFGGRAIMGGGSLLCGLGFLVLAHAHSVAVFYLAWTILGVAMAGVLYDAAFATITYQFGMASRRAISMLTLFGGFASTVAWPATLKINAMIGWRDTFVLYAALQFALCLPLHLLLGPHPHASGKARAEAPPAHEPHSSLREATRHPAFWHLAFSFAANSFIASALSAHMVPLLHHFGHPTATVLLAASLIGPLQVAGRLGEMTFARHASAEAVGKFTFAALPGALAAMLLFGQHQLGLAVFCFLYGTSNGILTIVKGTIPLSLFGARNYGAITGALAGPSLLSRAAGPLVVAALIQAAGAPQRLFALLLACSLASLLFFLLAVRAPHASVTPVQGTP